MNKDKLELAHAIYHERIGIICADGHASLEAKEIAWQEVKQQIKEDSSDRFFWHKVRTFIRNN
jgi:hypothetical protein